MSVNGDYNNGSSTSLTSAVEAAEARFQEAQQALMQKAKQHGQSLALQVQQQVTQMKQQYEQARQQADPNYMPEDTAEQLETLHRIVAEDPAFEPEDKHAKRQVELTKKELRKFSKEFEKGEQQAAREESLKKGVDREQSQRRADARNANAKRVHTARRQAMQATPRAPQSGHNVAVESQQRSQHQQLQNILQPLQPQANPQAKGPAQPAQTPAQQPAAQTAQKPAAPAKHKAGQEGKKAPEGRQGQPAQPRTATADASKPKVQGETQLAEDGVENKELTPENKANNVELANKSVQEGLASGALQAHAGAHLLDPEADVLDTHRRVTAGIAELLDDKEGSAPTDNEISAQRYAARQGAVRNAYTRSANAVIEGESRSGKLEDVANELDRVAGRAGSAAGQSTIPDTIAEDGAISAPKSREQLAALVDEQQVGFATADNDLALRMKHSYKHWEPLTDTAGYEGRQHRPDVKA